MILVYIEIREGKIKKSSLETLSEAKRVSEKLKYPINAVVIGYNLDDFSSELFKYGAEKVYLLENSLLKDYSSDSYSSAIVQLVKEINPEIILFPATSMGKDLAPRVAAELNVSLASDCTQIIIDNNSFKVVRPVYAGKAFAKMSFKIKPIIATLRPNIFPLVEPQENKGEVIKKELSISGVKAKVRKIVREEGAELDVTEAEIVISGGRGMQSAENFKLLRELASILPNSAIGASRSAVDAGWIGHQHQVGQTGKTVSPNLYMAFGISGAIQHLAGMSSSKCIVAVNKDPDAPIFKVATYGIVDDLFKIIPALKEELKKLYSE
ncbi:electron transfer flavoprotein subunit alpha/FixB family protein [Candidatus Aminicenantes bacterium AC-335-A11]|jgi:electron transfer flavoprotein alpha subunit|nr:electron transfer flavoprotein subunit alpha/FixB family protein [SCandidatus Aminicenantes bacterium Aminicenantia_JdfR_composite]MCP2597346.1 electron transfer flavoprotein subunit alpha/FixB family protein [Candidatus Aminicenantes bacterium AC-335-G13]MCP2598114.1 electron transfer flavoprotein subunit alpha/FixB family protein [Candidatus Aminicenantes bacterium AC-335-L06]MCP2618039.1 electron transfer flavoprotein subunit alpha/FixB family protein [Candidatus Aminicenantes bacterium AC